MGQWKGTEYWICEKHFSPKPIHKSIGSCPEGNCLGVRPRLNNFKLNTSTSPNEPIQKRRKVVSKMFKLINTEPVDAEPYEELCAYVHCKRNGGERAISRPNSIYCDDNCRKAKARKKYRDRKRLEAKQKKNS